MALDEGLPAPRMDWTAQRVVLGRPVAVWQLNLAALLAVLFVAFVGFSFSGPFLLLLVRRLGVTEPGAVECCAHVAVVGAAGGSHRRTAFAPADRLWLCGAQCALGDGH